VSRLYAPDPPITVEVDSRGRPSTVTWQRRESVREVVVRWRVPIGRTCCTVITPTLVLEIYRDDLAGDWYLQRVID
jgi:hypothetical protein